jgi:hypothetical protein
MKKIHIALFTLAIFFASLAIAGLGFVFKAAVTLTCILMLFMDRKHVLSSHKESWFIIGAFIVSILGDAFLSHMDDNASFFVAGIALYFLAHLGYLLFALKNGRIDVVFTIILLVVFLIFFFLVLYPVNTDKILLLAVLIYLLISCVSLGAAYRLNLSVVSARAFFAAIALILISDTFISLKEFTSFQHLHFLILPTYYAAHLLIAFALLKRSE